MAPHEIYVTLPTNMIINADAEFEVYSDGNKLGTLKISKGSVEWLRANHTYGYHVSWKEFDKIMEDSGSKY